MSRLNIVLLPTLGRPTMTRVGKRRAITVPVGVSNCDRLNDPALGNSSVTFERREMRMREISGMRLGLLGCVVGFAAVGLADDDRQAFRVKETLWTFEAGYSEGKAWIGSEDARFGSIYQLTYLKPEPRLRFKSNPAQALYGVYFMPTRAAALDGNPANTMYTWGVKLGARYWNEYIPGWTTFLDLGWGVSYAERTTQDLPNQLNSTPFFGIGVMTEYLGQEYVFSIRWHHMSNGATNNDNQGFNAIQYSIGVRF
ncbi:hypothetical protein CCB80_11085 [Armatimonadetes bacterium Uphvl-Ar1]|nr:hypothetical protein CCB80_11085 [Armatimonadetes bacterium Uphvl-Ar1]